MSRVTSPNYCFSDNVKFMVMMNFEFKVLTDIPYVLAVLLCCANSTISWAYETGGYPTRKSVIIL